MPRFIVRMLGSVCLLSFLFAACKSGRTVSNIRAAYASDRILVSINAPSACTAVVASFDFPTRRVRLCNEGVSATETWIAVETLSPNYGARFRLIDIQDDIESDPRSGWSWVGVQRVDDAIVGVVDWAIESPGHELLLLVSADQGETFRLRGMVKKPHYMATFKAFSALANGDFELAIGLDDCADCGVPLGTYRYRSDDGGRFWKNSGYTQ